MSITYSAVRPVRETVIKVENVTQRFRVIQERPDSVREIFSKFFRPRVKYHDFEALSNVSLNVYKGETLGLVGHNGSGKSTLLKLIAGVYRASSGSVQVNGAIAPLIELGAGFHSELTGRENIMLNGLLMGYSKAEMRAREDKIIEFADIGDFIDAPVKQYSSGMYIRLAFSVATEVNPDILIMDEILAVGDIGFQQKCFDRLSRFHENGATIIMVTHSPDQVLDFCDRVAVLEGGQKIFDGLPDEGVELYKSRILPDEYLVEAGS